MQKWRSPGRPIRACIWASASCPSPAWAHTHLEVSLPTPGTWPADLGMLKSAVLWPWTHHAAGLFHSVSASERSLPLPVCDSLANGSAALIAVGNTSRSEFIKHLKRYGSSSGQVRAAVNQNIPNTMKTYINEFYTLVIFRKRGFGMFLFYFFNARRYNVEFQMCI